MPQRSAGHNGKDKGLESVPRGLSRRELLASAGIAGALGTLAPTAMAAEGSAPAFRFCLNTATIMGQKLPIAQVVEIAAKAGYQAIEPWIRELEQHVADGHSLRDLKIRIADLGLSVESAIGFAAWCVDDDAQRAKGFEQARRDMDLVAQIGGKRIAAPPAGVSGPSSPDLFRVAERYRQLLEIGRNVGVLPQVENWGMSKTIGRLGQAVLVAVESGHPDACLLPDVYHIYRGGSAFGGLALLRGSAVHVFHMNDYPADPPRDQLNDAHRVYPGDGAAPLAEILRTLRTIGFTGFLSLELFNRDYWSRDPFLAAKTGLEKMQQAVQAAGGRAT